MYVCVCFFLPSTSGVAQRACIFHESNDHALLRGLNLSLSVSSGVELIAHNVCMISPGAKVQLSPWFTPVVPKECPSLRKTVQGSWRGQHLCSLGPANPGVDDWGSQYEGRD